MSKTAVIFKHTHNSGSCLLGKVLEEKGFQIRSMGAPVMDFEGFDPLETDLLLVMGAPVSVNQVNEYPFIDKERKAIKARAEADKPILGVCFGAQILASALGADVYLGDKGREIGWSPLMLTEAGQNHPARHLDGSQTNMFHWHQDTFDLPEGATLLASSDKYPHQIYSYGNNILGLQCHPEVRRVRLEEHYVVNVHDITGPDATIQVQELREQGEQNMDQLNRQTEKFFVEWLESVNLI